MNWLTDWTAKTVETFNDYSKKTIETISNSETMKTLSGVTIKTYSDVKNSEALKKISDFTSNTIHTISNSETVKAVGQFTSNAVEKVTSSETMKTVSDITDKTLNNVVEFLGLGEKKKILLLGLDGAGKTTLLHSLLNKKLKAPPMPTKELVVHEFEDVIYAESPGHKAARELWKEHYANATIVLYLIDASDKERLRESIEEFKNILEHVKEKKPTLFVLTKLDQEDSIKEEQVAELLKLEDVNFLGYTQTKEPEEIYKWISQYL